MCVLCFTHENKTVHCDSNGWVITNITISTKLQHHLPLSMYLHERKPLCEHRKTITQHRIKYCTTSPQAVICLWRQQPLRAIVPWLIATQYLSSLCYFSGPPQQHSSFEMSKLLDYSKMLFKSYKHRNENCLLDLNTEIHTFQMTAITQIAIRMILKFKLNLNIPRLDN